MTQQLRAVAVIGAIALILVGWKFTSVSMEPGHIQNDGYNVTGGFMMLVGGFILGWWWATKKRK